MTKPTIQPLKNGPYVVRDVGAFRNSRGEAMEAKPQMALCRCGGSSNKPLCDGTHVKIGFDDSKKDDRTPDKVKVYEGKAITIVDNRGVCSHRGYCSDELPSVWGEETEPNGASVEEIIRICQKCPSGALSYSLPGGERIQVVEGRDASIKIAERHYDQDGGYDVMGGVGLEGPDHTQPESADHYVLCRCGSSKNKPFCDGQHWHVKFLDETS